MMPDIITNWFVCHNSYGRLSPVDMTSLENWVVTHKHACTYAPNKVKWSCLNTLSTRILIKCFWRRKEQIKCTSCERKPFRIEYVWWSWLITVKLNCANRLQPYGKAAESATSRYMDKWSTLLPFGKINIRLTANHAEHSILKNRQQIPQIRRIHHIFQ